MLSKQSASQALRTLNGNITAASGAPPALTALRYQHAATRQISTNSKKLFSKSPVLSMREFFPETHTPHIRRTDPAWPHPIYTQEQMDAVTVAHRNAKTWSDYFALSAIRTMRWFFDIVSGYRHEHAVALNKKDPAAAQAKYEMNERRYMIRNIFLESVAGA